MQTATLKLYVVVPPRLAGTMYVQQGAISLVGRLDEPTHVVDLVGGNFRFLGLVTGNVVTGAYVDSLGLTGGFSAIDATHTAVTGFCGSYSSSGSDSGAIVLAVSSDGTAVASALTADASRGPQAFTGTRQGDELSLISKTGETLQGRLQGESATGGFITADGSSATFSITSSACH